MACGRWVLSEADNPPSHFDSKSLNHNIVKFNFELNCLRMRHFSQTTAASSRLQQLSCLVDSTAS